MEGDLMAQRICTLDGCERLYVARGWCDAHYRRWKRTGDPGNADLDRKAAGTCAFDGCERKRSGRTYCIMHLARQQRTGDPAIKSLRELTGGPGVCDFRGCERTRRALGLCAAHYLQKFHGRKLAPLLDRPDTTARDGRGRKLCGVCNERRSTDDFYPHLKTKDGLGTWCTRCQKSRMLQRSYGITLEDYEVILAEQGGVCAICMGMNRDGRKLFVDHDHDTGAVRGLLCNLCNRGIGNLRDSIPLLESAINYLKRGAHGGEAATS